MPRAPSALENGSPTGAGGIVAPASRLGERLAQRGLISAEAIPALLDRQRRWGCRFGETLIAEGAIKPVELAESLADGLSLPFVDLIADPPDENLIEPARLALYLRYLFLPWRKIGATPIIACADPSPAMRRLVARLYGPRARIAITGKFDIIWTAQRLFRERLNRDATFRLDERAPEFSARRVVTPPQIVMGAALALALVAGFVAAPQLAAALAIMLLSLCYGANIVLRLLLFAAASFGRGTGHRVTPGEIASLDEAQLPVYSILVPLYREAHMVSRLVAALKQLDYPGIMAQTPQAKIAAGP